MGTVLTMMELVQCWREGRREEYWGTGEGRGGDGEPANYQEEQESQLPFLGLSHFRGRVISGD